MTTTTTIERTRPLGLSWLETRIYDALSTDYSLTINDLCRAIEAIEPGYRTTESSVVRTVSDLGRRGIATGEKTPGGWRWRRATTGTSAVADTDPRPARRPVSMSALTSQERRALRAIERDEPCSGSSVARAVNASNFAVTSILAELEQRGLIESNGVGLWQTTTSSN